MSRNVDPTFAANLASGYIRPVIMAMLTFRTMTSYCWSGVGTLVYNGQSFLGVGSMGKLGMITEGSEIRADGTTVELSGIDPIYQAECLTDIQVGLPAKIWFGSMLNGALIGTPFLHFSGVIDKSSFNISVEAITITLNLENKMLDHARPSMRRYTSADQHLYYPTDTAFGWVESLSDSTIIWGS